MEANRLGEAERGQSAYTNRDRVVAAYKRSFADRVPVYPIVASFAGTLDGLSIEEYCTNVPRAIAAMLNYYERYQPDVVLAYNDLAKEAEAFGCRVKYSDYVVPSIDQHVLQDDKGGLARLAMPDPYATAPPPGLPRAVRGPGEGQAPHGDRRRRGGAVDHRHAAAQPRDDAAGHLRGPAVHPRRHAGHHRLLQGLGRGHRQDGHRALLLRADRLHQPDLARQLSGVRGAVPHGTGGALQGAGRSGSPPTSAGRRTRSTRTSSSAGSPRCPSTSTSRRIPRSTSTSCSASWRCRGDGRWPSATSTPPRSRGPPGRRWSATCGAASTRRPGTRPSSSRPPARSLRGRIRRPSSGSCARRTTTAATTGSSASMGSLEDAPCPGRERGLARRAEHEAPRLVARRGGSGARHRERPRLAR